MDIQAQLVRIAKQDLTKARLEGEILVAQTKRGTLTVRYSQGRYGLYDASGLFFSGRAKGVAEQLAGLYQVEVA